MYDYLTETELEQLLQTIIPDFSLEDVKKAGGLEQLRETYINSFERKPHGGIPDIIHYKGTDTVLNADQYNSGLNALNILISFEKAEKDREVLAHLINPFWKPTFDGGVLLTQIANALVEPAAEWFINDTAPLLAGQGEAAATDIYNQMVARDQNGKKIPSPAGGYFNNGTYAKYLDALVAEGIDKATEVDDSQDSPVRANPFAYQTEDDSISPLAFTTELDLDLNIDYTENALNVFDSNASNSLLGSDWNTNFGLVLGDTEEESDEDSDEDSGEDSGEEQQLEDESVNRTPPTTTTSTPPPTPTAPRLKGVSAEREAAIRRAYGGMSETALQRYADRAPTALELEV